jgi:hypothetical protein
MIPTKGLQRYTEGESRTSTASTSLTYSPGNGEQPLGRDWQVVPKCHCGWRICAEKIATMASLIEFAAYAILTLGNLAFVRVIAVNGKTPRT